MSRLRLIIAAVAGLMISAPAVAGTIDSANNAILKEHFQVISEMAKYQFKEKAAEAMTVMVAESANLLDVKGFHDDAARIRAKWKTDLPHLFNGVIDQIGDHDPLNDDLALIYDTLRQRLGDQELRKYHLDDINTINYTAPVVFQPAGDRRNGDTWNQAEYTRHFVPFSGIVSYWTSYLICIHQVGTEDWAKSYCGKASLIMRNGMQNLVAPQLASAIYQHANGHGEVVFHMNGQRLVDYYRAQFAAIPHP
jgi:hypothetical protein